MLGHGWNRSFDNLVGMTRCQRQELLAATEEEWVGADQQRAGP